VLRRPAFRETVVVQRLDGPARRQDKKELLKSGSAYRLENKIGEQLDAAYRTPDVTTC
jgi:hypothetical protein